ncbi:MAG: hypothetical protein MOGMAGMI_01257 [Candidatus Omnitrophica bacterium]|nr:hypothetical protein [Candidatus Omnitrophota bacterium]
MRTAALLTALCLWTSTAVAAQDAGGMQLRNQANADVIAATRLVQQADEMVRSSRSVETLRVSMQLFVQAGRLYEQSAKRYQALVPDYASQADVDNAVQAMQYCIRSIQEIQKLAQGRKAQET